MRDHRASPTVSGYPPLTASADRRKKGCGSSRRLPVYGTSHNYQEIVWRRCVATERVNTASASTDNGASALSGRKAPMALKMLRLLITTRY